MGRETREKIMLTAIKLFNEEGVTNVSTVKLSNELHISPGNLYYYFENKEHLIRSIWEEMLAPKISDLFYKEDLKTKEEGLIDFFLHLANDTYSFRFFYLELPAILNNDPELKKLYRERAIRLMKQMDSLIQGWVENGMMVPKLTPIAKNILVQNCWMLSQTGIIYTNMLEDHASFKDVCDNISQRLYALLRPYFSDKSHEKIMALFAENNLDFHKYA